VFQTIQVLQLTLNSVSTSSIITVINCSMRNAPTTESLLLIMADAMSAAIAEMVFSISCAEIITLATSRPSSGCRSLDSERNCV
jgi:hypothetical protein